MRSGRTGFTLMELLVVTALIAIVAAMVFPVFLEARTAAREASCKSNLKELGAAMQLYRDDWGQTALSATASREWGTSGWMDKLFVYHRKVELYQCPARNASFAYAMNARLATSASARPVKPTAFITLFEVPGCGTASTNSDVFGNSNMTNALPGDRVQEDGATYAGADILQPDSCLSDHCWTARQKSKYYSSLFFPGPHNGASNVLFYDGHVRRFTDWKLGAMTFDPASTGYAN